MATAEEYLNSVRFQEGNVKQENSNFSKEEALKMVHTFIL